MSSSSLPAPPLMRTRPAVLRFSLYYPPVTSDNYESILPTVTDPIKKLLCENNFFLISSRVQGENVCPDDTERNSRFDINDPYFGDANFSVLMETPAFVQDDDLGDVSWTTWTIAFYVAQLGQPVIEMAQMGTAQDAYLTDLKVSEVMNDVLRLALEVSVMEGELDKQLDPLLPGAHVSLKGNEVETWSNYDIFSSSDLESLSSSSRNPPQHQLFPNQPISSSSDSMPQRMAPSIVATAMYEKHSLRHGGICMFLTMLFLWLCLIRLGSRGRKIREKKYEIQQQQFKSRNVQLATEEDVSEMLMAGKGIIEKGSRPAGGTTRNGNTLRSSSTTTTNYMVVV